MLLGQGQHGGIGIGYAEQVSVYQGVPQPTAESAYLKTVERIAPPDPPGLIGREAELAELARFCLDPVGGPHAWWRAGPWAGKSALLSTFVLRPPAEVAGRVRIVSFFITARLAAQDTREAFTAVMLEQLAALLGQSLPPVLPEATREAYLLGLLSEAAAACAAAGERLVLVLDGLDEDRGVTTGPAAHSIAGLIPADPPAGMRVIVAGRPNPPVPDDVPDWHPLRDPAIIRPLADSPHARDVRRLSRQELQRLLQGSRAERDVLGLLAAARGGLSAWDIAELARVDRWEVADILHTVAGRTLQSRPSILAPEDRPAVYLLGHEELHEAAMDYLGDRLPLYRKRLHNWAARYRSRGWPSQTPEYLLGGYFRLLEDLGDLPRMIKCALDMVRHDRMLDLTGGDAAALAETRTVLGRIAAQAEPDLTSALSLACHRDHLADRNADIPDDLPAVWASLGQLARAQALADSLKYPSSQATALAHIAKALTRSGLHQQAVVMAVRAEAAAYSLTNSGSRAIVLAHAAVALAGAGQHQQAEALAVQAEAAARADPGQSPYALARVAWVLATTGRHLQAEALARSITTDSDWRATALSWVAESLAEARQRQHAEAVARSITSPIRQASALADIAEVLSGAGQYQDAEAIARSITDLGWGAIALAQVAGALAGAGQHQLAETLTVQAEAVTRSITEPVWRASALARIAVALARTGRGQQAEASAAQACAIARSVADSYVQASAPAEIDGAPADALAREADAVPDAGSQAMTLTWAAGALAEAGQHRHAEAVIMQAEAIARSITDPTLRTRALVGIAQELAEAGQHRRAEAVIMEAEAVARAAPQDHEYHIGNFACALAAAGQPQQAAAIARSITGRDWRQTVLAMITEELAEVGQCQHAEAIARSITEPDWRARSLDKVARALATAGQHEHAEAIARSITEPVWRASALAGVARALAAAGQHQRAEAIAAQAEAIAHSDADSYFQGHALGRVAGAWARAGRYQQAKDIAHSITHGGWHAGALTEILEALLEARQRQQAEDFARSIASPASRATALARVAEALAEDGRHEDAEAIAAQAAAIARSVTPPSSQAETLARIAEALTRVGQQQDAEDIARSITEPVAQAHALARVAVALVKTGRHQQAEAIARSIIVSQGFALAQVAEALARAGENVPARRLATASCATGDWSAAARPVLLLAPSAFETLARTLEESSPTERAERGVHS